MPSLSRILLDPARRETRRIVSSPNRIHGTILSAFDDEVTERSGKGRVLWRLDSTPTVHRLYVVSDEKPNWGKVLSATGFAQDDASGTKDYEPLLAKVVQGSQWRFRLRANTVRCVRDSEEASNTQRRPCGNSARRLEWLEKRLPTNGYSALGGIESVVMHDGNKVRFHRSDKQLTQESTVFDGVLVVEDQDLAVNALLSGIGRRKAFGCGLLTLAPAS